MKIRTEAIEVKLSDGIWYAYFETRKPRPATREEILTLRKIK